MSDFERSGQRSHDVMSFGVTRQKVELTGMREKLECRDPLYLFACHLEWRNRGNIAAYQELVAALDDPDCDIRVVAEVLLYRNAPRPDQPREMPKRGDVAG